MSGSTSPVSLIIFHCIERTNNEVPRRSIGLDLTLDDFQKVSDQVPFLADLKPSGKYVMEDIHKVFFFLIIFLFYFFCLHSQHVASVNFIRISFVNSIHSSGF